MDWHAAWSRCYSRTWDRLHAALLKEDWAAYDQLKGRWLRAQGHWRRYIGAKGERA